MVVLGNSYETHILVRVLNDAWLYDRLVRVCDILVCSLRVYYTENRAASSRAH